MVKLLKDGKSPRLELDEYRQTLFDWERELEAEFESWGYKFVAWARECGALVQEVGLDYFISLGPLSQFLQAAQDRGRASERHAALLAKFSDLVTRSGGHVASYDPATQMLRLSKPGSAWGERDLRA